MRTTAARKQDTARIAELLLLSTVSAQERICLVRPISGAFMGIERSSCHVDASHFVSISHSRAHPWARSHHFIFFILCDDGSAPKMEPGNESSGNKSATSTEKSARDSSVHWQSQLLWWHSDHEEAFQRLKDHLAHVTKLVHFREDYPLILASDASAYGVGAVLMHRNAVIVKLKEKRYPFIYAVNKFHQYVYGRHFELVTDHKPLVSIFHPKRKLPVMTAQRLQRWAITLMAYTFTIRYKPTAEYGNADGLSRLPAGPDFEFDSQVDVYNTIQVNADDGLPMQAFQLAKATAQDVELNRVYCYMRRGWPEELSSSELLHTTSHADRRPRCDPSGL
uniref:Reverse transcriptase/retrotransposon-derived protein RNase H-like domain-containing protein n=1 Tax=Trichuris muris TaxID=70415 RepID=A0A5S6QI20_TRIMR